MKTTSLILVMLFLVSFIGSAQPAVQKSNEEDKVYDMIARLPEVINSDRWIIKKTKGNRHLVTYIDDRPTKQRNYYVVTVSEDNGSSLVSHFKFIVFTKSYAISYWAVIEDKFIPLAVWRKHHYKDY